MIVNQFVGGSGGRERSGKIRIFIVPTQIELYVVWLKKDSEVV